MTDLLIVTATFWFLVLFSLNDKRILSSFKKRTRFDWAIDILGLMILGILVPIAQLLVVSKGLEILLPSFVGGLELNPFISILCSFVFIDYLYYWNHRLLHQKKLWPIHVVHHSSQQLDVFSTARNSTFTFLFFIYIWAQGFFVFILKDPFYFLFGAAIGSSMDLWRHSRIFCNQGSVLYKLFSLFLIMPQDHEWHHSSEKYNINFGANFNLWDKIHGTFYRPKTEVKNFGVEIENSWLQSLFLPWRYLK